MSSRWHIPTHCPLPQMKDNCLFWGIGQEGEFARMISEQGLKTAIDGIHLDLFDPALMMAELDVFKEAGMVPPSLASVFEHARQLFMRTHSLTELDLERVWVRVGLVPYTSELCGEGRMYMASCPNEEDMVAMGASISELRVN